MAVLALLLAVCPSPVWSRDDGRYAGNPLRAWFEQLRAKGGDRCCSDADGEGVLKTDWDMHTEGNEIYYRVRIEGVWQRVPDEAVVIEPNLDGRAIVWTYTMWDGNAEPTKKIRCFLRGTEG